MRHTDTTVKDMTLFHGSANAFTANSNQCLYMTANIKDAKEYALGDCYNYNKESFIYALDISEEDITIEEDFDYFDCMGYLDYENISEVTFNPESGYYCIKHPENLRLVEYYTNSL